jgi:hypothetical protein
MEENAPVSARSQAAQRVGKNVRPFPNLIFLRHRPARPPHYAGNRRDIADEVEFEICIERGVARIRKIGKEDRIAIGARIHDRLGRNVATSARPVLNDERLAA